MHVTFAGRSKRVLPASLDRSSGLPSSSDRKRRHSVDFSAQCNLIGDDNLRREKIKSVSRKLGWRMTGAPLVPAAAEVIPADGQSPAYTHAAPAQTPPSSGVAGQGAGLTAAQMDEVVGDDSISSPADSIEVSQSTMNPRIRTDPRNQHTGEARMTNAQAGRGIHLRARHGVHGLGRRQVRRWGLDEEEELKRGIAR